MPPATCHNTDQACCHTRCLLLDRIGWCFALVVVWWYHVTCRCPPPPQTTATLTFCNCTRLLPPAFHFPKYSSSFQQSIVNGTWRRSPVDCVQWFFNRPRAAILVTDVTCGFLIVPPYCSEFHESFGNFSFVPFGELLVVIFASENTWQPLWPRIFHVVLIN